VLPPRQGRTCALTKETARQRPRRPRRRERRRRQSCRRLARPGVSSRSFLRAASRGGLGESSPIGEGLPDPHETTPPSTATDAGAALRDDFAAIELFPDVVRVDLARLLESTSTPASSKPRTVFDLPSDDVDSPIERDLENAISGFGPEVDDVGIPEPFRSSFFPRRRRATSRVGFASASRPRRGSTSTRKYCVSAPLTTRSLSRSIEARSRALELGLHRRRGARRVPPPVPLTSLRR
jgi:hypothetical protein